MPCFLPPDLASGNLLYVCNMILILACTPVSQRAMGGNLEQMIKLDLVKMLSGNYLKFFVQTGEAQCYPFKRSNFSLTGLLLVWILWSEFTSHRTEFYLVFR